MSSAVSDGTKILAREISLNCSYEFRRLELPRLIEAARRNKDNEALEMFLGLQESDRAMRKAARERSANKAEKLVSPAP